MQNTSSHNINNLWNASENCLLITKEMIDAERLAAGIAEALHEGLISPHTKDIKRKSILIIDGETDYQKIRTKNLFVFYCNKKEPFGTRLPFKTFECPSDNEDFLMKTVAKIASEYPSDALILTNDFLFTFAGYKADINELLSKIKNILKVPVILTVSRHHKDECEKLTEFFNTQISFSSEREGSYCVFIPMLPNKEKKHSVYTEYFPRGSFFSKVKIMQSYI